MNDESVLEEALRQTGAVQSASMPERKCSRCGETRLALFFRSYKTKCKQCLADVQREYRGKRPKGYWQHKDKQYALKKRYGLTIEGFTAKAEAQGWKCAICGVDPRKVKLSQRGLLHVDHCHNHKRVRALLCNGCNRAIGLINERPEVARALADYLEKHNVSH